MIKISKILAASTISVGMCVVASSSMAFDLGGMLKQVSDVSKQFEQGQNSAATPQTQPIGSIATQTNKTTNNQSAASTGSADEYCQRITSNPSIIKLAEEIKKSGKAGDGISHTYLDNGNGDLEKWVANQFSQFPDPRMAQVPQQKGQKIYLDENKIYDLFKTVESCVVKNTADANNPLNIVFGLNNPESIKSLYLSSNHGKEFGDTIKNGKLSYNSNGSAYASLLAFLFPGAEEIISKISPDGAASFRLAVAKKQESINNESVKEDLKLYAGVRAVYKFRTNPAVANSYNSCVADEKIYQSKLTSDFEATAKNSNTVAEQNNIFAISKYRKDNISYFAHGMCVYRLSFGLVMLELKNEAVAATAALIFEDKDSSALNSKYTPVALAKVADILKMPADKFQKTQIDEPFKNALNELNNMRPRTLGEKQQIESSKQIIIMTANNLQGEILEKIIEPFVRGNVQGKK